MRCCRSASNGADGYCVQAKAALTVKNSSATASMNHGFGVMTGGKLVLKECQAGGSNGHGLHAINEGSVLEGETCTVQGNVGSGVLMCSSAVGVLRGCRSFSNGGYGYGAQAQAMLTLSYSSADGNCLLYTSPSPRD